MKAANIRTGHRVRVVKNAFNDGDDSLVGKIGEVGQFIFNSYVTVKFPDGDILGFQPEELALLAPTFPSAPMTATILGHLKKVGNISGNEANALYKCKALPRRIADLKDLGWKVNSTHKKDATGQRYVRYELAA